MTQNKNEENKNSHENLIAILKSDIVSPLEVIRTSCELLLKEITGKLRPEQTDFINRISKQSSKALTLIHDLVDMTKISSGFELNFVNLMVKDILDSVIPSFRRELKSKNLTITFPENITNFPFLGDIGRIEQVFEDIVNICIAQSDGKEAIKLDITPLKSQRKSDQKRPIYKISFTYHGKQLTEKDKKSIFEPTIMESSTPELISLPALKQIMLLHKGSISYESNSKTKGTYSIILPSSISTDLVKNSSDISTVILSKNFSKSDKLISALNTFKIPTKILSNPQKVPDTLKANPNSLLIFDYDPKDTDFNQFIESYNTYEIASSIPLIIYCKKNDQKDLSTIERFISDIITKPAEADELQTKLENYITPIESEDLNESKNKKMILVVEDDTETRNVFKQILSTEFSVTACKNGIEALYFLKKNVYSCAIFDAEAPGMDGIELITKVRQFNKKVPIIFSTKLHTAVYQRGASIWGVSRVLTKPFNENELLETIKETCDW